MEAIGWFVGLGFALLLSAFGFLSTRQGWKIVHGYLVLRRRGVWVPGVIERRIAPAGPFGVYVFTDLTGAIRFGNMAGGRVPKESVVVTQIRYDPWGRVPPDHRPRRGAEVVGAVLLVLAGITLLTLAAVLAHGLSTGPARPHGCALQGC